jgi:hypothetical protein
MVLTSRRSLKALAILVVTVACARGPGPPDWGTKDIPDWGPPEKSPVVGRCYHFPGSYIGPLSPRDAPAIIGFNLNPLPAGHPDPRKPDGSLEVYALDSMHRARPGRTFMRGVWWNRGQDSVDVWWGSGFTQTTFELRIAGDSLRGGATWRDDTGKSDFAVIVAKRVDCPYPP